MKRYGYLFVVAALGALAVAVAIPPNPCPGGGDNDLVYELRTFTACLDDPGYCTFWSWNYGYTWACDIWCCYDEQGQYQGKLVGDCEPAEGFYYNGGCCNNLVSCQQAKTNYLNNFPCPVPQ